MTGDATPYHHGDLRRALLDAAAAILAETGRWDFSLREVARRAGVSHNAPYRHFPDKDSLLAAVGVAGYAALREHTAVADADAGAPVLLSAMGRAYVDFGTSNPALYRLMFAQTLPRTEGLPETLARVVGVARGSLRDVIQKGADDGAFAIDPADRRAVTAAAVAAWSLVHGLTMLTIDHVVERETGARDTAAVADQAVALFVRGLERRRARRGERPAGRDLGGAEAA